MHEATDTVSIIMIIWLELGPSLLAGSDSKSDVKQARAGGRRGSEPGPNLKPPQARDRARGSVTRTFDLESSESSEFRVSSVVEHAMSILSSSLKAFLGELL